MVQEFHVVRCFSCQTFQVQQVKKVNKWRCKLCGEKQSLLKEFGRGSGIDCRRHVQKLNAMRGVMMEEQECNAWSLWEQEGADGEDEPEEQRDDLVSAHTHTQTQVSCWSKYLDTANEDVEKEEDVLMDRQQPVVDRKRKRREEWTNRQAEDSWTPEQSNWSSLMKRPVKPSAINTTTSPPILNSTSHPNLRSTSPPSLNNTSHPNLRSTSPPSLNNTSHPNLRSTSPPSLNNTSHPNLRSTSKNSTSPPSKKSVNTPSVSSGPVSRWARFLSSDCQVHEEGEELSVNGRSQSMCEAASLSHNDTIQQTPPLARPHPMLTVSSMFQSGDDFDDEFFTC
uniref:MRN complex-interacting protein n=1 Tax=Scatophagus argus TaxID=75038 RepID=UPI001ED7F94A|nr:MRN complex-interacting protein [Scatophagus argus]